MLYRDIIKPHKLSIGNQIDPAKVAYNDKGYFTIILNKMFPQYFIKIWLGYINIGLGYKLDPFCALAFYNKDLISII